MDKKDGAPVLGAASNLESATNPKSDSQDSNKDESNSNSLECPICLQPCIHPVELPCSHIFCFLCIKGVAAQNPHSRCAICRQDIPGSVFTNPQLKDISQLYKNPTVPSGFQWFYESRSDGWWSYDERTMQELEKAYETKKSTFQVMIAGHMYEIDFEEMKQYRVNNPTMFRRIKRDLPTIEKRGIAGIRLNNKKSDGTNHPTGAAVRRGGSSASSRNRSSPSNLTDHQRVHSLSMPHLTSQVDGPPVFEVDTDSDEDVLEDEEEEDSLEEEEGDDDDEDMELGEEEDDNSDENDDESGGLRDGARAPTSRSDRSNSSTTHTTPPSTPSNGGGPYTNGQSGSRTGKASREKANSNSTSSGNSRNNSAEPIIVNLESENSLQLLRESNVQSPSASNPSFEIDANVSNCNNILSSPQPSSPTTSDNNQYLLFGPSLQIRFNTVSERGPVDEIL